jgi:hypothetical protein
LYRTAAGLQLLHTANKPCCCAVLLLIRHNADVCGIVTHTLQRGFCPDRHAAYWWLCAWHSVGLSGLTSAVQLICLFQQRSAACRI